VKVIVGETAPQAQQADAQVGEHAARRPHNRVDWNVLRREKAIKSRSTPRIELKSHVMLLLEDVDSCEYKLEHQIDCVDDNQRFLSLPMRIR
jgi:hypothetical protein